MQSAFKPTVVAALLAVAFGATLPVAEAGNYCGLGIAGLGCGVTNGMTDSTGSGWVGPAPQLNSGGGVLPGQSADGLTQAIIQARNGQLPLYFTQSIFAFNGGSAAAGQYMGGRNWDMVPGGFQPLLGVPASYPAGYWQNAELGALNALVGGSNQCGWTTVGASENLAFNGSSYAMVVNVFNGGPGGPCTGGGGGGSTFNTCFPAGSRVLMADGSERRIETIHPGEWVMGADGVPVQIHQVDRPLLGPRRMLAMADGSTRWSEEHSFWTRDAGGAEWWWSASPDTWRAEVEQGAIGGLRDNSTLRTGAGFDFAHMSGWRSQTVVEADGFGPETPLYLPMTNGVPIIVDGYVVGAGVNEAGFDYRGFRWKPEAVADHILRQALARAMRRLPTLAERVEALLG